MARDPIDDFSLLTLCDALILSVGTFGWWASYLADKETIMFKKQALPNTTHDKLITPKWFLPGWILLDV